MSITPGMTLLNKYQIREPIGEGGMARVWLAEEIAFGRRLVALKEPRADLPPVDQDDVQRRFHQEVTVCAALEGAKAQHIVRTFTAEPYEKNLLLVMAYMPGKDLAHRIAAHKDGMPIDEVVAIGRALLTALQAAHEHPMEIVHRDLKPSNVLFDENGIAHLADFGLAQIAGHSGRSQLKGGAHPGSPLYMAPEQASSTGYLLPAADIFALGCILFEMVTGKRYKRMRPGTRASQTKDDVPSWLDDLLVRALVEDPFDRYESAGEMLAALQADPNQGAETRRLAELAREAEMAEHALAAELASTRRREAEEAEKRKAAEEAAALQARIAAAERERERLRKEAEEAEKRKAAEEAAVLQARIAATERERERLRKEAEAAAQPVWQRLGIEMVRIPAGRFLYGDDKKPLELPEFAMAKTPVTNAQYKAFVDATKYRAPQHWEGGRIPSGKEKHPVVYVSWEDAQAFCKWAGTRLPNEQEWEKAARGTDGRTYPWGEAKPDNTRCNFGKEWDIKNLAAVGQYPAGASPYGLLDMAGNVWEWCEDWYDSSQQHRVLRGGAFYNYGSLVRCANRSWLTVGNRYYNVGFRVVAPGF
jgi:eukaryotic-like serine/threonine-protein kinase